MSNLGTCAHCKNEWYTLSVATLKIRKPREIPTCPEASIMVVCDECFDALTSKEIIAYAINTYQESLKWGDPASPGDVVMSPTEHRLVQGSISAWVPYLKGETCERPFAQESLRL